jgi:putative Mg2+ transporter-C (MgtC) family protein
MWQNIVAEFSDPFAATSWQVALLRMIVALFLGGVIGWERETRHKPAGLRTHMMVALAASLFTLLTFELVELDFSRTETLRTDPVRLIEAITAGVAFLAAGTIFTDRDKVRGLTTGAGLWLAGAIGVACGLGSMPLAIMATALALLVLLVLRRLEHHGKHKTGNDGSSDVRPPPP